MNMKKKRKTRNSEKIDWRGFSACRYVNQFWTTQQ